MCMPAAAIGRPVLEPWVQPSIDFICNTRVCVSQQQLVCQMERSEPSHDFFMDYSPAQVCVFTAFGRPTLS